MFVEISWHVSNIWHVPDCNCSVDLVLKPNDKSYGLTQRAHSQSERAKSSQFSPTNIKQSKLWSHVITFAFLKQYGQRWKIQMVTKYSARANHENATMERNTTTTITRRAAPTHNLAATLNSINLSSIFCTITSKLSCMILRFFIHTCNFRVSKRFSLVD